MIFSLNAVKSVLLNTFSLPFSNCAVPRNSINSLFDTPEFRKRQRKSYYFVVTVTPEKSLKFSSLGPDKIYDHVRTNLLNLV